MGDKSKRVNAAENRTYNCSQKVFLSFCEEYGVSREQGLRMTGALGGGLRAGESCGALVGALLVVGLKHGTAEPKDVDQKALCDEKAREISAKFKQKNRHIACRDILGIDTSVADNRFKAKERGLFDDICPGIIENMVELLEEMGY